MTSGPRQPSKRARGGFTLVELLVVISIMAIIIAIALPGFQGIGKGTAMKTSAEKLRATLSLARQWAITHREKAYVVFPDDDSSLYSSSPADVDKALRAFNVYSASEGYIQDWNYLPQGIIFDSNYAPTKNVINNSSSLTLLDVGFPDSSTTQQMWCVAFRPDGTVYERNNNTQPVEIFLTEGWTEPDTKTGTLPPPEFKPKRMLIGMEVFPWTGQIRVNEYDDFL